MSVSADILQNGFKPEAMPEINLIGMAGDAARGSMGLEVTAEEAHATLEIAAGMIVSVPEDEPTTCMDDGESGGLLSDKPSVPRLKQAGGDAMGAFLGDELTRSRRAARGELRPAEQLHAAPVERMRGVRKERLAEADLPTGTHLRLQAAEHGGEGACGCGMADKQHSEPGQPGVHRTIVEEAYREGGDRVAAFTAKLMRTDFSHDVHAGVITDAARLIREFDAYGWSGNQFIEGVRHPEPGQPPLWESSPYDDHIEVTAGGHAPVALGVYYGDGTLDRDSLVAGTGLKLLWIDEPSIWREACRHAPDPTDLASVRERYQALMTANVAGALTLGAKHLYVGTIGTPQPAVLPGALVTQ